MTILHTFNVSDIYEYYDVLNEDLRMGVFKEGKIHLAQDIVAEVKSKIVGPTGGKWDPSLQQHGLKAMEEPSPTRTQPDQGARVKAKDPEFCYIVYGALHFPILCFHHLFPVFVNCLS